MRLFFIIFISALFIAEGCWGLTCYSCPLGEPAEGCTRVQECAKASSQTIEAVVNQYLKGTPLAHQFNADRQPPPPVCVSYVSMETEGSMRGLRECSFLGQELACAVLRAALLRAGKNQTRCSTCQIDFCNDEPLPSGQPTFQTLAPSQPTLPPAGHTFEPGVVGAGPIFPPSREVHTAKPSPSSGALTPDRFRNAAFSTQHTNNVLTHCVLALAVSFLGVVLVT